MSVANKNFMGKRVVARQTRAARAAVARRNAKLVVKAGAYDEELIATAVSHHVSLFSLEGGWVGGLETASDSPPPARTRRPAGGAGTIEKAARSRHFFSKAFPPTSVVLFGRKTTFTL